MSVRALCVALAIFAGCGRIGFDEPARSGDGGGDAMPGYSAWSAPVHQTNLQSADNDWEGTIDSTGMVLVFARQNASDSDLMVATRPSKTADFGVPAPIPGASGGDYEFGAAWSFDNTRLYFYFDDGSTSMPRYLMNMGIGTFSATSQPATELPSDGFSWEFSHDGTEVFYTTAAGPDEYDIHHATRGLTTEDFVLHDQDISALQRTTGSEGWPTLDSSTENVLYFERDTSSGGVIYQATRSGRNADFGDLAPVDYLPGNDGDPDLSNDDLTLVIDSDRLPGLGNELFILTRTKL